MQEIVNFINNYLSGYILVILLVSVGLYFTVRTRFVQVRCFKEGVKKLSQTEKGVLIFSEWFEAMENLNANDFKRMIYAIYRLQICGEKPLN
jgi:Na+/alanine symporter